MCKFEHSPEVGDNEGGGEVYGPKVQVQVPYLPLVGNFEKSLIARAFKIVKRLKSPIQSQSLNG